MRKLFLAAFFLVLLAALQSSIARSTAGPAKGNDQQVTICHFPPGNPAAAETLTVGRKAVDAHLAHHQGDHVGACTPEELAGPSDRSFLVLGMLVLGWGAVQWRRRQQRYTR